MHRAPVVRNMHLPIERGAQFETEDGGVGMPTTMAAVPHQTVRRGRRRRAEHIVREGITVGLIGAAVAMLLFLVVDVAAGVPLHTPAILGSALFYGTRSPGEVAVAMPAVLGYTVVHLAGFALLGLAVSGLFALAEREKRVLALIFMLGCCPSVIFIAMVYVLSQWMRDAMTPWIFLAGHALAGAAMVAALVYFHHRLLRQFPTAAE
jgi:hypothetical protein